MFCVAIFISIMEGVQSSLCGLKLLPEDLCGVRDGISSCARHHSTFPYLLPQGPWCKEGPGDRSEKRMEGKSDSLQLHGPQGARLPCPSLSPRVYSNSCPLSQWCYPTMSSSAAPFSSCPQSFPASGSFPMSQLFPSGGQSIGASASVLPVNIQGWFPLGLTGLISLLSKGLSRVLSNTTIWKHQFFGAQPLWSNSHICTWLLEKS